MSDVLPLSGVSGLTFDSPCTISSLVFLPNLQYDDGGHFAEEEEGGQECLMFPSCLESQG